MCLRTKSGQQRLRHTTCGWSLLVQWKNEEEEWTPLNRIKQSLPLETTEFAVARGIDDEPAFKWWFPYTLRRRGRIKSGVNKRIITITHNHGVELSASVAYAKKLDEKNGNAL